MKQAKLYKKLLICILMILSSSSHEFRKSHKTASKSVLRVLVNFEIVSNIHVGVIFSDLTGNKHDLSSPNYMCTMEKDKQAY